MGLHSLFEADLELNHFSQGSHWLRLEMVRDLGVAESVAPLSMAPWVKMEESDGSRRGQTCPRVLGGRYPNMGEEERRWKSRRLIDKRRQPPVKWQM